MSWQTEADKFVNDPVVLCDLALSSGILRWSTDFVRPESSTAYVGQILSLPIIGTSIGDLARTFDFATVKIILADPERLLREAAETEGIKNKTLTIKISFSNIDLDNALVVFTGRIYQYKPLDGLRYEIEAEQTIKNMFELYPDKNINSTDYPSAFSGVLGLVIPVVWGTVSSVDGPCRTFMVDETQDAEKHLVGLQHGGPLTVTNVRLNGVLKTEITHYTITTQTIDGKVHTLISWVAGVRPISSDLVTCNAAFTSQGPVKAIKFFMINFCGYEEADFDATSYTAAVAEEDARGYTLDGIMNGEKMLASWIDQIRNEFELDVWLDMSVGKIKFQYLGQALDTGTTKWFHDYLDIINYEPDQKIDLLMNWCRPGYNYDYVQQNFKNYGFAEDADSQTKYGAVYKSYPTTYFIRNSDIADDIAVWKVVRQRNPIKFEKFQLPLKTFSLSLAEVVRFTHFDGPGIGGYDGEFFQLRKSELDLNQLTLSGIFENIANFYGNEMILGNEDTLAPDWLSAPPEDQYYAYMADETTGKFSNGDEGKHMNSE
jgi:hypothetical protein